MWADLKMFYKTVSSAELMLPAKVILTLKCKKILLKKPISMSCWNKTEAATTQLFSLLQFTRSRYEYSTGQEYSQ